MKLTVLVENHAGAGFGAEHGLSYLIEVGEDKLLFDTGHSDLFLRNAQLLDIDLKSKIDTIVLSHGHWDHGDGLRYLEKKRLITHPATFMTRYRNGDHSNVGLELSRSDIENRFNLVTSEGPYSITPSILFLGEIPRSNDFESKNTSFIDHNDEEDFVPDDSGLAIIVDHQLVIISGCAHSGICNMVDYAEEVTGVRKIKAVVGGFHLKDQSLQLKKTIACLKEKQISMLFPSHCTELPALAAFYAEFKIKQLKSGMILDF